jgi:hypothetical protein
MAEIPKERLEQEIQNLAGNQARIALHEIRKGKTIDEAIWIAKSFPQERDRPIELFCTDPHPQGE